MPTDNQPVNRLSIRAIDISCKDCSLNPICLPVAVNAVQLVELDSIIKRSRPLRKEEYLFRASDPFHSIFAVRSGTLKTYAVSENGEEQVTGFYLPGELLGIDGISMNRHTNFAKALETAAVCEIPFDKLEILFAKMPTLQRHFFQLLSREIQSDQLLIRLLSKKSAEERIAALLMSISHRHTRRGLSPLGFRLAMSRNDIGNYLGLAVETVSRVFTRLQKQGIILVDGKEVEVLDLSALSLASDAYELRAQTA